MQSPSENSTARVGRLSRGARITAYIATGALTLSGLFWLYARYGMPAGDAAAGPWAAATLAIHGACAIAATGVFGALIASHVAYRWRRPGNRLLGYLQLGIWIGLLVTGYALYYIADETTRPVWSAVHWTVGLLLPATLAAHALIAQRTPRRFE
jgi:hypothetical protein